jgi:hypothetical protein
MGQDKTIGGDLKWRQMDDLIEQGLKRTALKLIEKEKKNNGYLIIAGKDGKVKKVPAKDL